MPSIAKLNKTKRKKIRKVVFIDRDGVINYDNLNGYITAWKDFHFIPGALGALKRMTQAGYAIIIISNQAGVGDGIYTKTALDHITAQMLAVMKRKGIKVHSIHYCLHGKNEGCQCRKPKTGLLRIASRKIHYNRKKTFLIGDKASDILAGKRFGLKTAFVLTGHGSNELPKLKGRIRPDLISKTVRESVTAILSEDAT